MPDLPAPVTSAIGCIAALAAVAILMYAAYQLLEHVRRLKVFAAVFVALAVVAWFQESSGADGTMFFSANVVLTALGRAALAFIGGNGFALLPESGGSFELHVLFQLLSLMALALTAESVLSVFTTASSWLSTHVDHFEQAVVVVSSSDMAPVARPFISDAARGEKRPRAVFSIVRDANGTETYRLSKGDSTCELPRSSFRHRLLDVVTSRSSNRIDDGRLSLVTFGNGRVTVTSYADAELDSRDSAQLVSSLMDGATEKSPLEPEDIYSYSLEEVRVRQLVRRLLPTVTVHDEKNAGSSSAPEPRVELDPRFELGLRPLCAAVIGDDIERVVLTVVYLVRNGQALRAAHRDGSVEYAQPRILVASSQAERVERRLRSAYPMLFSDGRPVPGAQGATLTAPADVHVFSSKFAMLDSVDVQPDDLLLVINTNPDTGRAPSQREVWRRRLQGRLDDVRPVYIQYSEDEDADSVFEDSYGSRTTSSSAEAKRVIMYGNATESMRAAGVLHKDLDRRAMLVNYRYSLDDGAKKPSLFDDDLDGAVVKGALVAWQGCRPYDRESSRATADFAAVERLLWETGIGELPGRGHGEQSDQALRWAIGQLEHLRWNAYLITTGFTTKRWDTLLATYVERLERDAASESPQGTNRVFKQLAPDLQAQEHPALVDWEFLPALDALYQQLAQAAAAHDEPFKSTNTKPNQKKDCDIIDELLA